MWYVVFRMFPPTGTTEPISLFNTYQNITSCNVGEACSCPATNSNSTLAFNSTSYSVFHPNFLTIAASSLTLPLVMGANVTSAMTGFQIAQTQPYFNGTAQAYVASTSSSINVSSRVNNFPTLKPLRVGSIMLPTSNISQNSSIQGTFST